MTTEHVFFVGKLIRDKVCEIDRALGISPCERVMEMDEYLEENGASYTGSIIFAGAWIESMYLALNSNKNSSEKIINRLSEQSIIIGNIIGAVKQANEDKEFDDIIASLEKIEASFKSVNESSTSTLTTEQVNGLKVMVTEIRNNLIKG